MNSDVNLVKFISSPSLVSKFVVLFLCSCAAQSTKTTKEVVVLSGAEEYSRSTSAVRSNELLEKYWFCPEQRTTKEMVLLPHSTGLLRKWLCCFGQITIRVVVVLAGEQD